MLKNAKNAIKYITILLIWQINQKEEIAQSENILSVKTFYKGIFLSIFSFVKIHLMMCWVQNNSKKSLKCIQTLGGEGVPTMAVFYESFPK